MKRFLWMYIIAMCLTFVSTVASAQNTLDSLRNRQLDQIVVTGTGTHSRAQHAVVPVQVITAEDLQRTHTTNLEDALRQLTPSITSMTNGMGTTLMMNGLNEDYILILENGKRLTGDDRYTCINMAHVKRIEILSGAASSLYGSEAIGGVVNIITEGSNMYSKGESQEHVSVSNQSQISSKGRLSESISVDITKGRLSSSTSFQHRQADGWQVNTKEEVMGVLLPTGRLMSQGFGSKQINQQFGWNFGNGLSVYIKGSYYDYRTNRPQMARYFKGSTKKNASGGKDTLFTEAPAYSYDLHREDYLYGAGATWKLNSQAYLEADFYSDNLMSERDSFDTYQQGGTQLTKRTHYYNGTLKGIFRLGHFGKLSAGMEYVLETYKSYNFRFQNMYSLSIFAQDEVRLCRDLQGVLGLRYIFNENFGSYATPNIQLMYSFHPAGEERSPLSLRAGYSAGYRTPTLLQMFYENDETKNITIGNTDLRPEKSNYYNFNVSYFNRWLTLEAGAFLNDLRDMIAYRVLTTQEVEQRGLDQKYPTATKYQQRDNIDKAKVKGLHLSATLYLPQQWRLGGAYTYTDTKATTTTLNTETQQYETTTAPTDRSLRHTGRVFASWGHTWKSYTLDVDLNGHLQSRRWSTSYGWAPRYSQFDLHTTHTWALQKVSLVPGIGVENIFNKRDTRPWNSNFSTLHPGRCVYVSFAVKYKS